MDETPELTEGPASFSEMLTADLAAAEAGEPEAPPEVESAPADSAPDEAPVDAGQAELEVPDQPQMVTVTIDGVQQEVTLEEAAQGYQRQADYTRKTQEAATALKYYETLQQNPQAVFQELAQKLGVDADTLDLDSPVDDDLDPLEAQVNELAQWRQEQLQAESDAAIFAEVEALKVSYAEPDLDPMEFLQYALDHQIEDLDAAMRARSYDRLVEEVRAAKAVTEAQQDAEIVETKREAPPIQGGAHRNGTQSTTATRAATVREAFESAVEEHGGW